jgi:hypothetical protein
MAMPISDARTQLAGPAPDSASMPAGAPWPPMDPMLRKRHLASIALLCEQLGLPFDDVAALYGAELARLAAQATVADFLPVLVGKHIRQHYRAMPLARP